jgi:hypothetical protein
MALSTNNPTETNSWKKLEEHFKAMKEASMQCSLRIMQEQINLICNGMIF